MRKTARDYLRDKKCSFTEEGIISKKIIHGFTYIKVNTDRLNQIFDMFEKYKGKDQQEDHLTKYL